MPLSPPHALYILLDSNLPTGGFVASAGLESYAKHGCLRPPLPRPYAAGAVGVTPEDVVPSPFGDNNSAPSPFASNTGTNPTPRSPGTPTPSAPVQPRASRPTSAPPLGPARAGPAVVAFTAAEMGNFEASTGAYLDRAWGVVAAFLGASAASHDSGESESESDALGDDLGNASTSGINGHTAHPNGANVNGIDDPTGTAANSTQAPPSDSPSPPTLESTVAALVALDAAHESTLLSHVGRRASRAQGVALLTLHARGMGPPPGVFEPLPPQAGAGGRAGVPGERSGYQDVGHVDLDDGYPHPHAHADTGGAVSEADDDTSAAVVGAYKRAVRRGSPGHLAVCFGVVTATLGMDLATTHHLYLFTHARSVLSSAVRLNLVGPYLSTQLLAHPIRALLEHMAAVRSGRGYAPPPPDPDSEGECTSGQDWEDGDAEDEWGWADAAERGPATTWPLGEILAARHDLQHSRIFNS